MNKFDLETGTLAVRTYIDKTGYGSYVSNEMCSSLAKEVIQAVDTNREIHNAKSNIR